MRKSSSTPSPLATPANPHRKTAHQTLWRKGIGSGIKRRLPEDPALILRQEMGVAQEEADELITELLVARILTDRSGAWIVVAIDGEEDLESSPEFLKWYDIFTHRDITDDPLQEFVGTSSQAIGVRERIELAAEDDNPVMITGESGVGKGIAARLIHRLSPRKKGPLVHLNCASLPDGTLESELFGHEKGAFTSAQQLHRGCFERADGGTLFLDEIGEISLAFQSKLLQVVEDGTFYRVGGEKEQSANVRVIVATNRDLAQAVTTRAFRLDLFYRIYGIHVTIPPLRERRDDLPQLIAHYAAELTKKDSRRYKLSRDAFQLLISNQYKWPGNVRELQAVMRLAQLLARHDLIEQQHIEFPGFEQFLPSQ